MSKPKTLLVTYYWPPAGGPGVQRWLKFVKYLQRMGQDPIVYIPENPAYPINDESLMSEVPEGITIWKHSIMEPNRIGANKKNKKTSAGFLKPQSEQSGKEKVSNWIRANLFIPDARMLWIKPSISYLLPKIKEEGIDTVISTGPPHSCHLIARALKRKAGLRWIADFRDPWTKIDYFHHLPFTTMARDKHHSLERSVLEEADEFVVVTPEMKRDYEKMGDRDIHLIPNGYDADDMPSEKVTLSEKFTISHIGSLNADRNCEALWSALAALVQENEDFAKQLSIQLVGNVCDEAIASLEQYGLSSHLDLVPYVPHSEVTALQCSRQVLLLSINRTDNARMFFPAKVFEYMASGRPIFGIGPTDSDLQELFEKSQCGIMHDFDDVTKMKATLLQWFEKYQKGELEVNSSGVEKYSRKSLTEQLVKEVLKDDEQ